MRVGNLFRDEDYLHQYLTNDTEALSPTVAQGLMGARVNLNEVFKRNILKEKLFISTGESSHIGVLRFSRIT